MRYFNTGDAGFSSSSNLCACDVTTGPHPHSLRIGGE